MTLDKIKVPADSREALILAARTIFAEKGFDGTTVKDIADSAKLNVSLISYYFGGKDGLYREIVESFGKSMFQRMQRILTPADSLEEVRVKLKLWAEEFMESHVNHNDVTTIIHRDICKKFKEASMTDVMRDVFKNTFLKNYQHIEGFLKDAQKKGLLRKDFDVFIGAGMLFSPLIQMATKAEVTKTFFGQSIHDERHRQKIAEEIVSLFINGAVAKE